jgi:hypothetical protein
MLPEIEVTPRQAEFLAAEEQLVAFIGGVGSGKSHAGALFAYDNIVCFPKALGFIGANSYKQLTTVTLRTLEKVLASRGLEMKYNKTPPWPMQVKLQNYNGIISISNGAAVVGWSLDNPDSLRGTEYLWFWIDETRDTRFESFTTLLERLRGYDRMYPGAPYRARITTTPNGYNWLYDVFAGPNKWPGSRYISCSSYDNLFISEDYAATLESRFTKTLAQQQIYAAFTNLAAGRAFEFQRNRNGKTLPYDPAYPLVLSMDFNVAPLCGVVLQMNKRARMAWVVDEVCIPERGQTRDACDVFIDKWGKAIKENEDVELEQGAHKVQFWGDTNGDNRDTRGSVSDIQIMQQTLDSYFGRTKNMTQPKDRVKNGVNAVNCLLNPSKGEPRLFVDIDRCPVLVRDLEQVSWEPGTTKLAKDNDLLTHAADALRYPIAGTFPVVNMSGAGLDAMSGGFFA